jgi:uncharacterized protein with NAD-binding domain and iron-sulfur cluster
MASLTAAYELTSVPGWQDRYDITLYQVGWRLGGKGASGRNPAHQDRIEEHGLHILLGFYENAFRLLRSAYQELGRPPEAPLATWRQAFKPHDLIVLTEEKDGGWTNWILNYPRNDSEPGDGCAFPSPCDYVKMILGWIDRSVLSLMEFLANRPVTRDSLRKMLGEVGHLAQSAAAAAISGSTKSQESVWIRKLADLGNDHGRLLPVMEGFCHWLYELVEPCLEEDWVRRKFITLDLAATAVRGMVADGMIGDDVDWFAHDEEDFRDWLRRHGAREITIQSSAVRALYDICFAWWEGMGAGTMIHGAARMLLTYKGAIFYEMQAGMGDTVFAPLYQVLKRRGVRFEFFHRVDRLMMSEDGKRVGRIEMGVQMNLRNGGPYQPLYDVKGLPCWPSHPLYEQLERGEALRESGQNLEDFWGEWPDAGTRSLKVGTDFDICILGISLGAHRFVCGDLLEKDGKWRAMVDHVRTAQTQAMQLWFHPDLAGLGWPTVKPVAGAYVEPIATWTDMTHLVERENWPEQSVPGSLAYLCGVQVDEEPVPGPTDHTYSKRQLGRARDSALDFLRHHVRHLWPNAADPRNPGALDWSRLVDFEHRDGEARLNAQYVHTQSNPSDRYVLSSPGSARHRLRENGTIFDNLYLCGDYILTGMSAGCIEAAAMAGMQVSRAICGHPASIPGDWVLQGDAPPNLGKTTLPLYIERGGDPAFANPYFLEHSRIYSFLLRANYEALRATCDKYLNAPLSGCGTGIEYRPLGPLVAFACADIQSVRSLDRIDGQKGWTTERDVAFWVPVTRGRVANSGDFRPDALCWFHPYIWVDNGLAMASGRELYGFPKELADTVYPAGPADAGRFSVTAAAFETYHPDARVVPRLLVEATRPDAGPLGELAGAFKDGAELAEAVFELLTRQLLNAGSGAVLPSAGFLRDLWNYVARGVLRFVFLKQFRDVRDPRHACHQSIVEAEARTTKLHCGGWLGHDWRIHVHPCASHPIVTDLGLEGNVVESLAHIWLDFDFVMESGHVIWSKP